VELGGNLSRRNFLGLAAGAAAATALAACGTSGPSGSGGGGSNGGTTYWFLSGQPQQDIRQHSVDRWNKANPGNQIKATAYQNDP
jgi:raffinose/stachyose/melibiose transport system substrate-binding protein